jgi:hypothetical protein
MNAFDERFERLYPARLRERESRILAQRRQQIGPGGPELRTSEEINAAVGGPHDASDNTPKDDRVGVSLSGGGIRSATFCLGVFQGLAEENLLPRVDYLSTVSGGGYFGSFLGRLFTRPWIKSPSERKPGEPPEHESQPPMGEEHLLGDQPPVDRVQRVLRDRGSWCMSYLRDNGRYLSPNRTGDAWLAVAMFLRNWVSMLVVLWTLVFALFAGLAIVRALLWGVWSWAPGALFTERWFLEGTSEHLWWSPWLVVPLIPLVLGVVPAAVGYWFTLDTWSKWRFPLSIPHRHVSRVTGFLVFAFFAVEFILQPLGLFASVRWISGAIAAAMAWTFLVWLWVGRRAADKSDEGSSEKAAGAAPGGVERPRSGRDRYGVRNRLARILARSLKVTVALLAVVLIDALAQSAYALLEHRDTLGRPGGIIATVSSLVGIAGIAAFAQRLTVLLQRLPKTRLVQVPATLLAGLAGALVALILLGSASYTAHLTAWGGAEPRVAAADTLGRPVLLRPGERLYEQYRGDSTRVTLWSRTAEGTADSANTSQPPDRNERDTPLPLGVAFGGALLLSLFFGQTFGFFNLSSMHAFYSARLARAYLGASNPFRWIKPGGERIGTPIAGDDVPWEAYRPWTAGGPLHLVNQTLNETVSGKTQVEYRDRKGLIFAVGPAGLTVGRHDHALWGETEVDFWGDGTAPVGTATGPGSGAPPAGTTPGERKARPKGWRERYLASITPLNTEPKTFHALGLACNSGPGPVNLNMPDRDELEKALASLPGMKPEAACAIVEYRKKVGDRFATLEELRVPLDFEVYLALRPQVNLLPAEPFGSVTLAEKSKLGRHVAISGAAFTTGLGSRTSLGTSLLMGLFNVRLGYWWTIDLTRRARVKAGECASWTGGASGASLQFLNRLFPVQSRLMNELTARFHGPATQRWYLSDGGHFENTATYELLRRRVPFIVVCDCGQDRDYAFQDLSILTRQARVDFDAEITFLDQKALKALGVHKDIRKLLGTPEDFAIPVGPGDKSKETPRRTWKHALLARVEYGLEDGRAGAAGARCCSYILFLKPSVSAKGDEPQDVLHYQSKKVDFPNESTADQYFDEAQWESYRRLGVHIARKLFRDYGPAKRGPSPRWQPRDMVLNDEMRCYSPEPS